MDIHGNIDLFESLDKLAKNNNTNEFKRFANSAKEYTLQGFDQDQVAELLQIDGCSVDNSMELAVTASSPNELPAMYFENDKPNIYKDVKANVDKTILSGDITKVETYVNKYASKLKYLPSNIVQARDKGAKSYIKEIHEILRPLVEGTIIENNLTANRIERKVSSMLSEKEKLEYELFGIWPVYLIQKQANKIDAEEALIDDLV
jgi:hypothetical protein